MAPLVTPGTALVFGASGALGSAVSGKLADLGSRVLRVSRTAREGDTWLSGDVRVWQDRIEPASVNRVVFAQGQNAAGGLSQQSPGQLEELFEGNIVTIARWMNQIVEADLATNPCRVCIIGSVWATTARTDKLAYIVTKSAVPGLVRALNAELAGMGIAVNAILPGVVDTPMTRKFLSAEAIAEVERATPGGRLVTAQDVAEACAWLTSPAAHGISGQSLVIDGGWSSVRTI